jgi:hypothetical protein
MLFGCWIISCGAQLKRSGAGAANLLGVFCCSSWWPGKWCSSSSKRRTSGNSCMLNWSSAKSSSLNYWAWFHYPEQVQRQRSRSRLTFLREGDAHTKFFHLEACHRSRKNFIDSLQQQGMTIVGKVQKEGALFQHFDASLAIMSLILMA